MPIQEGWWPWCQIFFRFQYLPANKARMVDFRKKIKKENFVFKPCLQNIRWIGNGLGHRLQQRPPGLGKV